MTYAAPVKDMQFLLHQVLGVQDQPIPGYADLDEGFTGAVLEEAGKLASEVLAPLNAVGDRQGCHLENGVVRTPDGFKAAFDALRQGGWTALDCATEFGGQGLPYLMATAVGEVLVSANMALNMYQGLTHGAYSAINAHGTAEQKTMYLPKLASCEWTGTMNLTEPHCGTDLGLMRTRAEPQADGSYKVTGTKIFISAGDHDMADNIVHLVLAKAPGGGEGTKGISLFIVPKFLPDGDGEAGERNGVSCGSIEHKMGIKASATCVLNFDDAKGYLIGEPNKGLNCMFTMMNHARLGTGMQGLCLGEASFQGAIKYANDRLQMRSLTGAKAPEKPADPIIVHPDVRRMLLTMKAFNEGNRALTYFTAQLLDTAHLSPDETARQEAEDLLAFLTPICKAFMTDTGLEVTNHGMQVFGGHGFIREWGMEQLVRDCRIAPIYEGTNGIQALDLLGRKVLGSQGKLLRGFTKIVHKFCAANAAHPQLAPYVAQLNDLNRQWGEVTTQVGMAAMKNADEVGAASVDYLMYSGYIILGYLWLRMALVAQAQIDDGSGDADYCRGKLATSEFYFKRLLPRTAAHRAAIEAGSDCLMKLPAELFAL